MLASSQSCCRLRLCVWLTLPWAPAPPPNPLLPLPQAKWNETLVAVKLLLSLQDIQKVSGPEAALTLSSPVLFNLQKARPQGWIQCAPGPLRSALAVAPCLLGSLAGTPGRHDHCLWRCAAARQHRATRMPMHGALSLLCYAGVPAHGGYEAPQHRPGGGGRQLVAESVRSDGWPGGLTCGPLQSAVRRSELHVLHGTSAVCPRSRRLPHPPRLLCLPCAVYGRQRNAAGNGYRVLRQGVAYGWVGYLPHPYLKRPIIEYAA